jgi:alanine dehydrogenase
LEALRSLATHVQDLVLGDIDRSSSLATSMSMVAERLEGQIGAATANGVRWGSCSVLVAAVSHFLELDADLEVLGSGRSA